MNIKSLLLGSAAALVAVSGARAADAIVVAEPEPAEYVRICDVYGAGYYYIPGTETCLKVGGYLRYDVGVGDLFGHNDVVDKKDLADFVRDNPGATDGDIRAALADGTIDTNDTYFKQMRVQVNMDARAETEYGTLRGYIALNFNERINAVNVFDDQDAFLYSETTSGNRWNIDHAIIQLGGLTVAYSDSLFESLTDSAGTVVNDDLVNFTPGKSHYIAYTFDAGNGFSATLGVEDGNGFDGALDSYVPHVVAGASWTQGWGKIAGVVAYDSNYEEVSGKVRVDVNVNDALSLWAMAGFTGADNDIGEIGSYYATWEGDWAVWGGGQYRFTEKAALDVQLSYDDVETFAAVVGVRYNIVPGFVIRPEVAYVSAKDDFDNSEDFWGGYLRFQRSF
ncbi:porin [Aquamicrobium terrae]|uniref:Porin n=2 Tax=Aquamicrobium terrae TaxID=1324945 RepID=A0ABV2MZ28_9HYPH